MKFGEKGGCVLFDVHYMCLRREYTMCVIQCEDINGLDVEVEIQEEMVNSDRVNIDLSESLLSDPANKEGMADNSNKIVAGEFRSHVPAEYFLVCPEK